MLEIGCICCGSDLFGHHTHPRPLLHSMCEDCIDEVKRMQREFQGIDRQPPSGVIQCRMPFQQGHSS